MIEVLHIDIETYSDLEIKDTGAFAYAAHPSFKVLLIAYALNDEPINVIDLTAGEPVTALLSLLDDPSVIKAAHNAAFEMTCLRHPHTNEWRDTMLMASELGYPMSLDDAAKALQLPYQKDTAGAQLIRLFCTPKAKGRRILPTEAPERWQQFKEYCKQDVVVEREIYKRLAPLSRPEPKLWAVDQAINKRGVQLDTDLATKCISLSDRAYAGVYERLLAKTGLDSYTDAKLKAWMEQQSGGFIPSLSAKEIGAVRENFPQFEEILDLRAQLSKTSIAKYKTMLACSSVDGRARGLTQFLGAGRTGRWAGRLIQLQNLPRISLNEKQLHTAREAAKDDTDGTFELLYSGTELQTISQLVRTALIPKPSCRFAIADFSAIEARVLAWLANEQWRLDIFRGDGKIYEASAERMFNLPVGSVGKSSPYRQKGKVAELALGYGGGVGALTAMGALNMGLSTDELQPLVTLWRAASPNIVQFWKACEQAIRSAIEDRPFFSPVLASKNILVRINAGLLQIRLPSCRWLSYVQPQITPEGVTYMGQNQTTRQWERQKLYGAKATENITQAVARDCLAEILIKAEDAGLNPVFHVHDEIVCEVNDGTADNDLDTLLGWMRTPPAWAGTLPLRGDGFVSDYYDK